MGCSELRAAELKAAPKRCEMFQKEPIYPGEVGAGSGWMRAGLRGPGSPAHGDVRSSEGLGLWCPGLSASLTAFPNTAWAARENSCSVSRQSVTLHPRSDSQV